MHYDMIVFLDKGTNLPSNEELQKKCPQWVYDLVSPLMEPFSEHTKFEPYEKRCSCSDLKINLWVEQAFYDAGINKYHLYKHVDFPNKEDTQVETPENIAAYEAYVKDYNEKVENLKKHHPLYGKFDSDCYECNGTGIKISTLNPNGKWDYYVPYVSFETVASIPSEDLAWSRILTPDGIWHDSKTKNLSGPSWQARLKELAKQYEDHPALQIDCHT
jgi:hypothetical protein